MCFMRRAEAARRTGLSGQSLDLLIEAGIIEREGRDLRETSIDALMEGAHYVTCQVCDGKFIQLSQHLSRHGLRPCLMSSSPSR